MPADKLIRKPWQTGHAPYSRQHIYFLMANDRFPKPVKLSTGKPKPKTEGDDARTDRSAVAWRESDLIAWQQSLPQAEYKPISEE